ncbi:MAG TPA: glutathione S-transferase family protein [Kofleriaceae bacterium]|jgi:glutathione S-transferase|nr:glutathione S-transferase family protein [Kofleriaceae bacterium]
MKLTLHYHPLSSFCWKVLVGLYELDVPFEPHLVDLSNPDERAALARLWPLAKFPVLQDGDRAIPESTIILEYVDRGHRLIPADPARALECRLRDRIYDAYIHAPMQAIVGDRLRPAEARDAFGVDHARERLETAYAIADDHVRTGIWAMGDDFTLADCAAFPALYYANRVAPLGRWKHLSAYLARLTARPSVARVLHEAQPYLQMFPT